MKLSEIWAGWPEEDVPVQDAKLPGRLMEMARLQTELLVATGNHFSSLLHEELEDETLYLICDENGFSFVSLSAEGNSLEMISWLPWGVVEWLEKVRVLHAAP